MDSIVLGARDWWVAAAILVVAIFVIAIWSYTARQSRRPIHWLIALAKLTAVLALGACLLEPMRRTERPRPGANVMAVLVDNSRSMEIHPQGSTAEHLGRFKAALKTDSSWQTRMAQDFEVRRYAFDQRVRAVDDLADLSFLGNHSSLGEAVSTLNDRFQSRPVAGMMLFSDGLSTDSIATELEQRQFHFPIYPVVFNERPKLQDVSIGDPTVTMSSFELAPASLEAMVRCIGFKGEKLAVRLFDGDGESVERQLLDCDEDVFEKRVRFQYRPKSPGLQFVKLRAMLSSEDLDEVQADSRREVTSANNSQFATIDRGGGPYRILYVGGRPNWEYKFIRRALEEEVEIELSALIRVANKEPKFVFNDRGVDASNPLFSGFSDNPETAEKYDEPVLIRMGVDEEELKSGFPKTEEALFGYHAIILDDIEAAFFTQQQMLLLRQFVAERGGGLLMLGGLDTFLAGNYRDTPLGDVLPIYLRGQEKSTDEKPPVRYRLTREGSLEPWLRLRANENEESARVAEMPEFMTWNSAAEIKPGASVLAHLSSGSDQQPGLVIQRFGKGRTMALLVGDMWRWSMRRARTDTDDLAQSWRQMARWLTADVPKQISAEVKPPANALSPHQLKIELRDDAYQPLDNATVKLKVKTPEDQEIDLLATPDRQHAGTYGAEFWSTLDGAYRCEVDVTGSDGAHLGSLTTGWTAQPSAEEFARVEPDLELLRKLAEASGGEVLQLNDLSSFVSSLPSRKVPITESRVEPLWHRPWLILLAIGCLCFEWGLRRLRGLP